MAAVIILSLLALAAPCVGFACTPADYTPHLAGCLGGRRARQYFLRPEVSCDGPVSLDLGESFPCTCALSEYAGTFEACSDNSRAVTGYTTPSGCNASVQSLLPQTHGMRVPCACTEADFGFTLTECVGDVVALLSYWKRRCSGGPALPERRFLSCGFSCPAGHALDQAAAGCSECSEAAYSVRGAAYLPPYSRVPADAAVFCEDSSTTESVGCATWAAADDSLWASSDVGSTAVMRFRWTQREPTAVVRFQYRTDTEPQHDVFAVRLGGVSLFTASGRTTAWVDAAVSLPTLTPAEQADVCTWSLRDACVHPNAFSPFLVDSFLTARRGAVEYDLRMLGDGVCSGEGLEGATNETLVVPPAVLGCTPDAVIQAVVASGALGVLFVGRRVGGDSSRLQRQSGQPLWVGWVDSYPHVAGATRREGFSHHVAPGVPRAVEFLYTKDRAVSVGQDRVWVRRITVDGTRPYADHCIPCLPGMHRPRGATVCTVCPAHTHRPAAAERCLDCPAGHTALPGSTVCTPLPRCTVEDYAPRRTPCTPSAPGTWRQEVYYTLADPRSCQPQGGWAPPANVTATCDECVPGTYRAAHGSCIPCPAGEFYNASSGRCSGCPSGLVLQRELVWRTFNDLPAALPSEWSRRCDRCSGDGFVLSTSADTDPGVLGDAEFTAGQAVPVAATAELSLSFSVETTGSVEFLYTLSHGSAPMVDPSYAVIAVTLTDTTSGRQTQQVLRPGVSAKALDIASLGAIPFGDYRLTWAYTNAAPDAAATVTFALRALTITGAAVGPAVRCGGCPDGFQCDTGRPIACTAGSTGARGSCTPCPDGTVSTRAASRCAPCPAGLIPSADKTTCSAPQCAVALEAPLPWGPRRSVVTDSGSVRWAEVALEHRRPVVFDLARLGTKRLQLSALVGTTTLFFSPCGALAADMMLDYGKPYECYDDKERSYGCFRAPNAPWVSVGSELRPQPLMNAAGDVVGVTLLFTDATCGAGGLPSRVIVDALCDPQGVDTVLEASTHRNCDSNFTLRSPHACPKCSSENYVALQTACEATQHDSERRDKFFSFGFANGTIADAPTCRGGLAKPATVRVECPLVTLEVSSSPDQTWVIPIVLVAAAVAIAGGIAFLVVSRNRIRERYQRLRSVADATEMEPTGPHDDGGFSDDGNDPLPVSA